VSLGSNRGSSQRTVRARCRYGDARSAFPDGGCSTPSRSLSAALSPAASPCSVASVPRSLSWFEHSKRRWICPLVGDSIQVSWKGAFNLVEADRVRSYGGKAWWDARVLEVSPDGRFLVHYLRWSAAVWDEWVDAQRIRHAPSVRTIARRWNQSTAEEDAPPSGKQQQPVLEPRAKELIMRSPALTAREKIAKLQMEAMKADCGGLEELFVGDTVELRCMSSLGRSPWLETTVTALVKIEWRKKEICPNICAETIAALRDEIRSDVDQDAVFRTWYEQALGTTLNHEEQALIPFSTTGYVVGRSVADPDNRVVPRNRLRLVRRGPVGVPSSATSLRCGSASLSRATRPMSVENDRVWTELPRRISASGQVVMIPTAFIRPVPTVTSRGSSSSQCAVM
jgi:hypothetical protein